MEERKLISFDWAMKKLLRSKANFVILEGFLSELLHEDIKILAILESESNRDDADDKSNIVDIKVENSKNEIILIEIQYGRQLDYIHRMLFGTSKVITEHLNKGDSYSKVVKVISVNILYFDFGEGDDYIYKGRTDFIGIHKKSKLKLNPKQRELYKLDTVGEIFPEYYVIKVNNFDEIAKDSLDEWIYFLKTEKIKNEFKAKGLIEAKKTLDYLKADEKTKKEYNFFKKQLHEQASAWESTYVIGKIEGKREGKIEGKREGKMEGKLEGKREGKIEIAKNLLKANMEINFISQTTGLSIEEIQKLKKD